MLSALDRNVNIILVTACRNQLNPQCSWRQGIKTGLCNQGCHFLLCLYKNSCKKTLKNPHCWYVNNTLVIFHIIFCFCNRQLLKNTFFSSERYKGCLITVSESNFKRLEISSFILLVLAYFSFLYYNTKLLFICHTSPRPAPEDSCIILCSVKFIRKMWFVCLCLPNPWQKLYGI